MVSRWIPALLLGAACWASEEPPVFHVNTQLVEVDVVVHGKNGPVADLTKNDFTILDNGKPQQVSLFEVHSSAAGPVPANKPKPLAPGTVSNRLTRTGEEPASPTVVLWDALNTETADQAWVRTQVIKYLLTAPPGDPIAVYILVKNLKVIQDFTDDPRVLMLALSKTNAEQSADLSAPSLADLQSQVGIALMAVGGPPGSAAAAQFSAMNAALEQLNMAAQAAGGEMTDYALRDQVYITQAALEAIAEHLSGLPGRKKLVWISGNFPAINVNQRTRNGAPLTEVLDFSPQINHAVQALNGANVAVYPMDPRGAASGALSASARGQQSYSAGALANASLTAPGIDTMNLLAGGTGGEAFYATNDASGAINTIVHDGEVTYRLGFYPAENKLDGAFHSLSVKVAHKSGESISDVRSRKGYFALDARNSADGRWRERLTESMQNPLSATQLGLRASMVPIEGTTGAYELELILDLEGLHFEHQPNGRWVGAIVLGTQFSPQESTKGSMETIRLSLTDDRLREGLMNGYRLRRKVITGTANGELHVVVEDAATGALGSVRVPLSGEKTSK